MLLLDELLNRRLIFTLRTPTYEVVNTPTGKMIASFPVTNFEGEILNVVELPGGDCFATGTMVTPEGERIEMGFRLSELVLYREASGPHLVEATKIPMEVV